MRYLLDTVGLVCAGLDPERLAPEVATALADRNNEVFASTASAWEIATKVRIGKLAMAKPFVDDWAGRCEHLGFVDLAISATHATRGGSYGVDHRDPFDRLICAQGELDGLTIVTNDPAFVLFPVTTFW